MSFSIQEGVDELRKKLVAEVKIAEEYPDAILRTVCGRSIWVSDRVVPTDVDIMVAEMSNQRQEIMILGFIEVDGMRLYQTPEKAIALYSTYLKTEEPRTYAALVELCKKRG